jgi:hypothetical protein
VAVRCLDGTVGETLFPSAPNPGWTTYPTLASMTSPTAGPVVDPQTTYLWTLGILLGGGFGAVTGAMVGLSKQIGDALKSRSN